MRKNNPPTDFELSDFQAETVSGAVKISWRTNSEQNILGFKVWRDNFGKRELVNEELIAGGFLKAGDGLAPTGDEYNFYDRENSDGLFYSLELIDQNGESRWFGPVAVQPGSEEKIEESSKTIAQLNSDSRLSGKQTDRLDLPALTQQKETTIVSNTENVLSQTDLAKDPNALKFEVRQEGWYRVGSQVILQNGFSLQSAANWKLFTDGREQPMLVNADGSIEFYGRGIDTLQTDAKIYWLVSNSGTGKRITAVSQKNTQSASTGWSNLIAERKDKIIRTSNILNGARENWYGAVVNSTEAVQTLNLNEIATESGQTAAIGVDIQGLGSAAHQVAVVLNGTTVGQINFSDVQRVEWTANVPLSLLVAGTNQIKLRAVGSTSDVSLLEAVRINYPHRSTAENSRLQFLLQAKKTVKLKGFVNQNVKVFDITNPENATQVQTTAKLETDGTYSATISSTTATRVLMAQDAMSNPFAVSSWTKNIASDLHNTQNQANFVIIAPAQFQASLENFKNYRSAQGLRTMIVDPTDIYDEFNNGMKSAEAIRAFLQFAKQSWAVKPDYALFVGDASVDPRNYSGSGGDSVNLVPTIITDTWNMETTSDQMMADFNNDNIEDISVGRLPVRNPTELSAVLSKILTHETFSAQEIKQRGVLMVSDAFIGYNFAAGSRNTASTVPADVNKNYIDVGTADAATIRQNVLDSMNAGPAVVNYFGHSTITVWTNTGIFRSSDALSLTNYSRPSLSVMLACLSGSYAEINYEALAEASLKAPNGGSFAVWAATGWNLAEDQEIMGKEFYRLVFSGMRLGDAARQAKLSTTFMDQRRTFTFFGDPTQRLF
ncbi:MAG TPA: C25 family cysteine peptidase [Pyrinomonadaceae bacterium]|nr:C25 family cysteine peptidase [Pyrinomonadaceae bacterium]